MTIWHDDYNHFYFSTEEKCDKNLSETFYDDFLDIIEALGHMDDLTQMACELLNNRDEKTLQKFYDWCDGWEAEFIAECKTEIEYENENDIDWSDGLWA